MFKIEFICYQKFQFKLVYINEKYQKSMVNQLEINDEYMEPDLTGKFNDETGK